MRFLTLLLVFVTVPLVAQEEESDPLSDRNKWSTVSYSFPSNPLANGFTSRERGRLIAPELPAEEASDEEVDDFLKRSHQTVAHFLENEGITLPEGSLVTFDPESMTLVARVPGLTHWSIQAMAHGLVSNIEQFIAMKGTMLDLPAAQVSEFTSEATPLLDHSELLAELKERESTNILQTVHMEARSGNRVKSDQTTLEVRPRDWELREGGLLRFSRGESAEGPEWELDAVVGPDNATIDLTFHVSHPLAEADEKEEVMTNWKEKELVALHRDQSIAHVTTSITMHSGETRLLGVWPSLGEDRYRCAFLNAHLVRNLPLKSNRLLGMVEERGETVIPIPEGDPKFFEDQVEGIPEGMFVQRFRIPPSFLSSGGGGSSSGADPFAGLSDEPRFTIRATAKDILQAAGIPFPPGSSANYLPDTSELVVRNTPENLDLVAAYTTSLSADVDHTVLITAHILEAPDQKVLDLADEMLVLPDHREALNFLKEADDAKLLSIAWLETRSGQRGATGATQEFNFVSSIDAFLPTAKEGEKPVAAVEEEFYFETDYKSYGTELEVDPQIGPDGVTIDLNVSLDYDYSPPQWMGELQDGAGERVVFTGPKIRFNHMDLDSALTMRSGATRILGHWIPRGKAGAEGQRQIAFIQATLLIREEEEESNRVPFRTRQ